MKGSIRGRIDLLTRSGIPGNVIDRVIKKANSECQATQGSKVRGLLSDPEVS